LGKYLQTVNIAPENIVYMCNMYVPGEPPRLSTTEIAKICKLGKAFGKEKLLEQVFLLYIKIAQKNIYNLTMCHSL
jgi:hypothetical protein